MRSLVANHLADVSSSDRGKPWFAAKLDFASRWKISRARVFPVVGDRLDYVDNKPVAALVHGWQKHFISFFLFVWPSVSEADVQTKAI